MNQSDDLKESVDTLSQLNDQEVTFGLIVTENNKVTIDILKENYPKSIMIELTEPDYERIITKTLSQQSIANNIVFLVPNGHLNSQTQKQLYDLKNSVVNSWIPGERKKMIRTIDKKITVIIIVNEKEYNDPLYSKLSESVHRV
jgi:hypothetical protein